jgi:hypothetical protein
VLAVGAPGCIPFAGGSPIRDYVVPSVVPIWAIPTQPELLIEFLVEPVTRGHETPGPAAGRDARLRGAFAPGAGRQCRRRKRTLADRATVERPEAASRLRGKAHASQAWRRALRARLGQGWRLPALRQPWVNSSEQVLLSLTLMYGPAVRSKKILTSWR